MAKKKRRTKTAKKRVSRKTISKKMIMKRKIIIVLNNLLLFVALSLVSFVLYRFLQNELLTNLFFVMSMVFGFISAGFVITLLVLFFMNIISKKKIKKEFHIPRKRRR